MTKLGSVCALCALLFACGPDMRDDDGFPGGGGDGMGSGIDEGEARQCDKMDIVFVIDDSGSMEQEQANLAANFPMFASILEAYTVGDGQPLDFRVAVTTTGRDLSYRVASLPQVEKGKNGEFLDTCGVNKRWLDRTDPTMAQTFACRAKVGTSGPSFEMPLLMSKWALADRAGDTNAGFLRPDALLALVILTDEDDASTTQNNFTINITQPTPPLDYHPADHVQFLDTLKGHRSRWAAGVIAGDGNCTSSFGEAADGVRLKEFVNLANSGSTQAVFSSICSGDLTTGLKDALDVFQTACGAIIL